MSEEHIKEELANPGSSPGMVAGSHRDGGGLGGRAQVCSIYLFKSTLERAAWKERTEWKSGKGAQVSHQVW